MSDQPKWMPDAERLCMAFDLSDQAWEEISDGERGPDGSWLDPLRAVVREAVEKALAEREARHREDLRVITEATRMAADKRAERHKREVIEAKLDEIDNIDSDAKSADRRNETVNEDWVIQWCSERADVLRFQLAALDKEAKGE